MALLLRGFAINQIMASAIRFGIPDLIVSGPKSVKALAEATGIGETNIESLMSVLVEHEVLRQEGDRYISTESTTLLAKNGALAGQALLCADMYWNVWQSLDHTLVTGKSAFHEVHGKTLWEYFDEHSNEAEYFAETMGAGAASIASEILSTGHLDATRTLVDIGAGDGAFVVEALRKYPAMTASALEIPSQIPTVLGVVRRAGYAERCTVIEGDMFGQLSTWGDTYVLMGVLHNWDDESARDVLRNIRSQLRAGDQVLVIERCLPNASTKISGTMGMNALTMQLLFGARERTSEEYALFLEEVGLEVTQTEVMSVGKTIICGQLKSHR